MKERQSNIELLRIVAMFLIVTYHVFLYVLGKYEAQYPIIKSFYTISHIGVVLFVLISGYFGIKPSVKGAVGLYLTMVFYNLLMMYSGWTFIGGQQRELTDIVKLFLPFSHSAPWYWFMNTYFLLYLVAPLLNKARSFVKGGLDTKSNLVILAAVGGITLWFGWINHSDNLIDGKNLLQFAFWYLIGAFIHDRIIVTESNRKTIRLWSSVAFFVLSVFVGTVLYFCNGKALEIAKLLFHPYSSPVLAAIAISVFALFLTFEFSSKAVNWAGASMLSVYLVHESKYFSFVPWYSNIENSFLNDTTVVFIAKLFVAIVGLMILSICIDQLRKLIFRFVPWLRK